MCLVESGLHYYVCHIMKFLQSYKTSAHNLFLCFGSSTTIFCSWVILLYHWIYSDIYEMLKKIGKLFILVQNAFNITEVMFSSLNAVYLNHKIHFKEQSSTTHKLIFPSCVPVLWTYYNALNFLFLWMDSNILDLGFLFLSLVREKTLIIYVW